MLSSIKPLSDLMIRQIAAGEVIERPASAVKEMLENALDAGATQVDISLIDAGKTLIHIRDNGRGIAANELPLALQKHATSKLPEEDLSQINFFGFRGEALASIASVAYIEIVSRRPDAQTATAIDNRSHPPEIRPAAGEVGTTIQVKELFHATPARLKFLRHERSELTAIMEAVRHLALCAPHCAINLSHNDQRLLQFRSHDTLGLTTAEPVDTRDDNAHNEPRNEKHGDKYLARIHEVLGQEFAERAYYLEGERPPFRLSGYIAPPAIHHGRTNHQYLCVNGRSFKDRNLFGALRSAYGDLLPKGRHTAFCLFIDCPPDWVDVNVHPAKTEVRFRDASMLRSLLVGSARACLDQHAQITSPTEVDSLLDNQGDAQGMNKPGFTAATTGYRPYRPPQSHLRHANQFQAPALLSESWQPAARTAESTTLTSVQPPEEPDQTSFPLGAAKAHVLGNYIIAETDNGIVLVDQHAAHERIVYEKLKADMRAESLTVQPLLVPEVLRIDALDLQRLLEASEPLAKLGLEFDSFGADALVLRSVPALLAEANIPALVQDILIGLEEGNAQSGIEDRLFAILSRIACHGSIRAGRRLHVEEMNALLRQIESTPNGGHCNHGRPTQIFLDREKIEKLFGRKG